MRVVLGCVLLALGACTYEDPSLDGTRFKCDAAHPCADGQSCVAGTCAGAGSGSSTADGVKCGVAGVCAAGQQCCAGPISTSACQATGTACATGASNATCDGAEDCGTTSACCSNGNGNASCGSNDCILRACLTSADCPGSTPSCCFDISYLPWGRCGTC